MKKPCLAIAALISTLVLSTVCWAEDTDQTRFYFGGKLGFGIFLSNGPGGGVQWRSTIDQGTVSESFQGFAGLNFDEHWGAEIAIDYRETGLAINGGETKIGEYSITSIIPQVRWRYPLEDGKLSPYVIAGVGVAVTEFNDPSPESLNFSISGTDTTVIGAVGGGISWFVANNISLDFETKFLLGSADLQISGRTESASLNTALILFGVRIYFPEAKSAPTK
jgi:opacity protein-like surface antigen